MKAQELRIGSIVYKGKQYGEEPVEAYEINQLDLFQGGNTGVADYYREWKPIPLTPEWLEKFGFKFRVYGNENTEYDLNIGGTYCYLHGWKKKDEKEVKIDFLYYDDDGTNEVGQVIKYVHQLQNLYFALTGEELTVKEKEYKQ